jgi:PAS domain S-box-containing protein
LSSDDAVIAADREGKILIFNDSAAKICGYSIREATGGLNIRSIYPGDGAREVMKKLRSRRHGGRGKVKSLHVEILSKSGELIPISLNAAIVYDGERETATIGFFRDLRETLRMKRELENTQIQLLQAEKMVSLGKLAAGVAHQLNNPLGGITLYAKLLAEENDFQGKVKEDLERIIRDAQRCRDIVKELLLFARQTRQEMRSHDINADVSRTLFLLENQALFQNIKIEKELAPNLPPVQGDIQQLNHLFMNIILNAAEAMHGKGRLRVVSKLGPKGKSVCVSITNSGSRIPKDVLPHIFEPFFTTKKEGEGTGLGLSLAYSIVENHGGSISVESTPEKETTFTVELKAADENEDKNG